MTNEPDIRARPTPGCPPPLEWLEDSLCRQRHLPAGRRRTGPTRHACPPTPHGMKAGRRRTPPNFQIAARMTMEWLQAWSRGPANTRHHRPAATRPMSVKPTLQNMTAWLRVRWMHRLAPRNMMLFTRKHSVRAFRPHGLADRLTAGWHQARPRTADSVETGKASEAQTSRQAARRQAPLTPRHDPGMTEKRRSMQAPRCPAPTGRTAGRPTFM